MGVACCRKVYYLNIEDEEINIGNFVSKRHCDDIYYYEKPKEKFKENRYKSSAAPFVIN